MQPWGSPSQPQVSTYALPSSASKPSVPLLQSAIPYRVKPHPYFELTAISCHFIGHCWDQHTMLLGERCNLETQVSPSCTGGKSVQFVAVFVAALTGS